jgi:hypothetical protein
MRRKLFGKYPPPAPDFRTVGRRRPEGSHERDLLETPWPSPKAQGRNPGEQLPSSHPPQAKSLLDLSTLYTLYVGAVTGMPTHCLPSRSMFVASGSPCIDAGTAALVG